MTGPPGGGVFIVFVDSLLRLPEVLAIYPVKKSTWYAGVKDGLYPRPVKIAARASAWRMSDIQKLIATLGDGELENA